MHPLDVNVLSDTVTQKKGKKEMVNIKDLRKALKLDSKAKEIKKSIVLFCFDCKSYKCFKCENMTAPIVINGICWSKRFKNKDKKGRIR